MRKIVLNEAVWLLIAAVVYGVWAFLLGSKEVFNIGMFVYSAVRISFWCGKLNPINNDNHV